ncbi:helix-turn-helix domain-containing protein [Flagellimonas pacifica]|uniref:Transcriptional regulator, AraC family n=1 Tax=Flagellimonas pacifica TaxID=1247520 RepID=A0A285MUM5_9FLAO|nr:AraC family transcriptional regulator [Allomuricauda parva]SNZ00818.1 transcriptional regulator, AraC family [Allomuricauda parva]
MQTRLKSAIFGKKTLIREYNEDFQNQDLKEREITYDNEYIRGKVDEVMLDGAHLSMRDIEVKKPYQVNVTHDSPLFKLHFEIQGSSLYVPNDSENPNVSIPHGHYNLLFIPEVDGTLYFDTKHRKTLEVRFSEFLLTKHIGLKFKNVFKSFGDAIIKQKPYLLWKEGRPISPKLCFLLNDIMDCGFQNISKKAYLEAKIVELLVTVLNEVSSSEYCKDLVPKDDYSSILKIDAYIKNNLKKTLTITTLSNIAGLNTSKLKKEFKLVFGTTIFKYITELRMAKAKDLIANRGFTVSEASYEVGYKNPQHFTAAFKRMFGYLPRNIKR